MSQVELNFTREEYAERLEKPKTPWWKGASIF